MRAGDANAEAGVGDAAAAAPAAATANAGDEMLRDPMSSDMSASEALLAPLERRSGGICMCPMLWVSDVANCSPMWSSLSDLALTGCSVGRATRGRMVMGSDTFEIVDAAGEERLEAWPCGAALALSITPVACSELALEVVPVLPAGRLPMGRCRRKVEPVPTFDDTSTAPP